MSKSKEIKYYEIIEDQTGSGNPAIGTTPLSEADPVLFCAVCHQVRNKADFELVDDIYFYYDETSVRMISCYNRGMLHDYYDNDDYVVQVVFYDQS